MVAHGRATCDLVNTTMLRNVIRAARPNIIVNAAAYTAVDEAEQDEKLVSRLTAIAPGVIAEEAATLGAWLKFIIRPTMFSMAQQMCNAEGRLSAPPKRFTAVSKLAG